MSILINLILIVILALCIVSYITYCKYKIKSISFKTSYDLIGLPILILYIGTRKFNFLIDTGSNDSILDKNSTKDVEYIDSHIQGHLAGMEGNKRPVTFKNYTFYLEDKKFNYDFIVTDLSKTFNNIKQEYGITLHGILGSRFFGKYKYIIDFNKYIIKMK